MAQAQQYIAKIPARVCGIPAQIGVFSYFKKPPHRGSPWTCDSDADYYGYEEMEWEVLDRRGRYAEWLERKITSSEKDEIEAEIARHFARERDEWLADKAAERFYDRNGW